jgi:RNA-directed DNA polymerase
MATWNTIEWREIRQKVFGIQKRIYKASREGRVEDVGNLQRLLVKSRAAKLLAVRMVTQDNQGRKTAGIDGIAKLTPTERMTLADNLTLDGKASPVRRVEIPKPGSNETRPLGIPTIKDRAKQALVKMALEPEWEAKFEPNSYGFRPGKSAHDAIEAIRFRLRFKPKYVLDGDISKCFDRIDHQALMSKIKAPAEIKKQIKAWLKAGIMKDGFVHTSDTGTPQGGVISPLLANIALHGMEDIVNTIPKKKRETLILVRYADDFVVIGDDLEKVKKAQEALEEFLATVGLEISQKKTRICHSKEKLEDEQPGFDFLGMNIRQHPRGKHRAARNNGGENYGHRLVIQPSAKAIRSYKALIKETIKKATIKVKLKRTTSIISKLKPILRGWANYHRIGNGAWETFHKLDEFIYKNLLSVTKRGVGGRSTMDTMWNRYWHQTDKGWRFGGYDEKGTLLTLPKLTDYAKGSHLKVKGEKSPFDGDWAYWANRGKNDLTIDTLRQDLIALQKGKCPECEQVIYTGQPIELHHKDGNHGNNKKSNLAILHRYCHQDLHSRDRSVAWNEEPDDGKLSSPVLEASTPSNQCA